MVKYRNPVLVILFSIITLGIYGIYWLVSTTNELRRLTSIAPDPLALFLLLIPVLNIFVWIWYYWKYSKEVEEISGVQAILLFLFWILLSPVSMIITQVGLNKKVQ
jgi:H+/Cl- antiporter ClcA